jgi:ATP-dependent DNA helicase PIF1
MVNRKTPLVLKNPLESDRGRRYRHVCAHAMGPSADERRERQRQQHQQRQARYSQRLRRAQGLPEADDMNVDPPVFDPPPRCHYLPTHQTDAIADFFRGLSFTQTDAPVCSTCFESYHGMHMHETQCDRCKREVPSLAALKHQSSCPFSLTVFQPANHRFTAANNADPGLLSDDLYDILHDFTQMEEMLCSLASPCFLMWVSKGGQYKTRGNVITFSQDITNLCTTLPRLPEHLDILVVRKNLSTEADADAFKDFRVRKAKVYRLLRFLKEHNRFYKDIAIQPPDSVDLPDDDSILHRLSTVEPRDQSEDSSEQASSQSLRQDPDADTVLPAHSELAHEQNSFVPSVGPLPSEQDAITAAMTDSGLTPNDDAPLPWPSTGLALSEYTTGGLFSMAFPTLFPTGAADFSLRRDRKVHLHEWVRHLMRYRDSRFATHPRFRFFALNIIFRHRSMQHGKYLFSRNISHHNMTIGQLKHALSQHTGARLASDIVRCLKTVKATRPYWNMEGGKLRDMIEQIGTPTLFYTLSMADMSWPDLHKLMPDDPFAVGLTPGQSSQIRFHNVARNPHIVANYLSTKHQILLDTVLQHLDIQDNARVSDFWYRFEWQARGSGKNHAPF